MKYEVNGLTEKLNEKQAAQTPDPESQVYRKTRPRIWVNSVYTQASFLAKRDGIRKEI